MGCCSPTILYFVYNSVCIGGNSLSIEIDHWSKSKCFGVNKIKNISGYTLRIGFWSIEKWV